MPIARILQWPLLLPLFRSRTISKRDRAIQLAKIVEGLGELYISSHKQHIGFVRLGVTTKDDKTTLRVRITHNVHFKGAFEKVPTLSVGKRIKFKALQRPLTYGSPTDFSSYLQIEYVR